MRRKKKKKNNSAGNFGNKSSVIVHTSKLHGQDVRSFFMRAKISQDVDKLLTFQKKFYPYLACISEDCIN
jgi:hypothetical protein